MVNIVIYTHLVYIAFFKSLIIVQVFLDKIISFKSELNLDLLTSFFDPRRTT